MRLRPDDGAAAFAGAGKRLRRRTAAADQSRSAAAERTARGRCHSTAQDGARSCRNGAAAGIGRYTWRGAAAAPRGVAPAADRSARTAAIWPAAGAGPGDPRTTGAVRPCTTSRDLFATPGPPAADGRPRTTSRAGGRTDTRLVRRPAGAVRFAVSRPTSISSIAFGTRLFDPLAFGHRATLNPDRWNRAPRNRYNRHVGQ